MNAGDDGKLFDDIVERELFLELVQAGTPEMLAGHEVSWTPRQTERNLRDPDFMELVNFAKGRRDDGVERVLYDIAMKGNMNAIAMILLNRRGSEFKDVKRIEVKSEHTVSGVVVHSVVQGVRELMKELGPESLQIGGALDVIDVESSEDT